MMVFSSMGQRESRWIGEPTGRAMDHLGNQSPHRPCSNTRHQKKFGEITRFATRCSGETAAQASHHYIAGTYIMVFRHNEVRQEELRWNRFGFPS